jgi:hypothetical protein
MHASRGDSAHESFNALWWTLHRKLNVELFGEFESYEGEGASDEDFTPRKAQAELVGSGGDT